MVSKTPPSTPVFGPAVSKVSESSPSDAWDRPWTLVSVIASEIESDTSPWVDEKSKPETYIVGKYGPVYEVAVDPIYFLGLQFRGCRMNLTYNPTQPSERQQLIYGANEATARARHQWFQHAADVVCSEHPPEIKQVYYALSNGFREEFTKAILLRDPSLPTEILRGFGVNRMDIFVTYLTNIHLATPKLQKPGNNILLLLTWSTKVDSTRQPEDIRKWARSEDGSILYKQLAEDFQSSQSVEQLALIMSALMSYERLLPDILDHSDQPTKHSYLADLGTTAEILVFALARLLRSPVGHFEEIITFLETTAGRDYLDQYLSQRINGEPHGTAVSQIETRNPAGNNDADWIIVHQSPCDDYTLEAMEPDSTEQSQSDISLKLDITQTVDVSTAPRATEEDPTPSCMVAISSLGNENHSTLSLGSYAGYVDALEVMFTTRLDQFLPGLLNSDALNQPLLQMGTSAREESSTNTLYGCTFSDCFLQFKDKSDWKKHETSCHFQPECWQCFDCYQRNQAPKYETEPASKQILFYQRAAFTDHLASVHSANKTMIDLLVKDRRIGRDCRSRIWCGFCEKIVVLQEKGLDGWKERSDHMKDHFVFEKRETKVWKKIDGSGAKGERD